MPDTEPTQQSTSFDEPNHSSGRKQLILIMEHAENPSNEAVTWTLKWMTDNAQADQTLLPYAPDVQTLDFENLIDFYQTSLVLQLRPAPRHVKKEVMKRLTDQPPTLDVLRDVYTYLPMGDPALDRAISSIHDHWCAGAYATWQLDRMQAYVRDNPALKRRRDFVFASIRVRKEREDALSSPARSLDEYQKDSEIPKKVAGSESVHTVEPENNRRRNRRAQQARGKDVLKD